MNLIKSSTIILLVVILNSCQISGNLKGLYSYKNEISSMIEIIESENYSCADVYSAKAKLVILNGKQLSKCIKSEEKVLVYVWQPNCTSSVCIDLNLLQQISNANNVTLFVVAEYYDLKKMSQVYQLEKPIIGIDIKYYKSDLTSLYLRKFLVDIGVTQPPKYMSGYYLFASGILSKYCHELTGELQF